VSLERRSEAVGGRYAALSRVTELRDALAIIGREGVSERAGKEADRGDR